MSIERVSLSPVQGTFMRMAAQALENVTASAVADYKRALQMVVAEAGVPAGAAVDYDPETGDLYWDSPDPEPAPDQPAPEPELETVSSGSA